MNLIVNALLEAMYWLASAIIVFIDFSIPDVQLPYAMVQFTEQWGAVIYPFSLAVNLNALSQVVWMVTGVIIGLGLFKFGKWGLSLIPFI